jgi:hypothetical protein
MQKCRLCQLREIDLVWNLGPSPYGDNFRPSRSEAIIESLHNFALGICKSCNLLQLCHETNLNEQYHQYLYLTKNTNNLIMYYSQLHKDLVQKFEINTDDLVIDIGGNDGSFLETFLTNGFTNLISIDPSIPAKKVSQDKGIKVLDEFFSKDAVEKIMNQNKVPKLISINYTLANVSNLQEFFENILKIMDSKTIISIVTG